MNPSQEIERLFSDISRISSQRGKPPPTTIIINAEMFIDWIRFCEEQDLDPMRWKGKQIIVDQDQPFRVAVSYHPEQEKIKRVINAIT